MSVPGSGSRLNVPSSRGRKDTRKFSHPGVSRPVSGHSRRRHGEIEAEVEETKVVRITGLNLPVDVFRCPNEMEVEDFDSVWNRASVMEDNVALPDPVDLYLTKVETGREQDWQDQIYLESVVKAQFRERLPNCSFTEAQDLFARFLDPETLEFALENPDAAVRDLALDYLRQFEEEGDPFSRDILRRWKDRNQGID